MEPWSNVKTPQNVHAIGSITIALDSRRHRKGNGFVRLVNQKCEGLAVGPDHRGFLIDPPQLSVNLFAMISVYKSEGVL